jgi:hypothetical protein
MRHLYCIVALFLATASASAQSPITYQGQISSEGQLYTGSADLRFTLYDAGSSAILGPLEAANVNVVNGVFTTELDLANLVTGPGFTLEIAVRAPAGAGEFITLSPRQPITAAPFAANTRGLVVSPLGNVGIQNTFPGRALHLGSMLSPTEGFLALSSRSASSLAARTWEVGVPRQDTEPLTGAAFNFVINDATSGRVSLSDPMFTVQYGTGRVGINTPTPQAMLDVNGNIRGTAVAATSVDATSVGASTVGAGTVITNTLSAETANTTTVNATTVNADVVTSDAISAVSVAADVDLTAPLVTTTEVRTTSIAFRSDFSVQTTAYRPIKGTATFNLPPLASGAVAEIQFAIVGVAVGDTVIATFRTNTFPLLPYQTRVTGTVPNTVSIHMWNPSTASYDAPPLTVDLLVLK